MTWERGGDRGDVGGIAAFSAARVMRCLKIITTPGEIPLRLAFT